jgi:hypothetical protein
MRARGTRWRRLAMAAPLLFWIHTGAACATALETRKMSTGESVRVEPRSAGEWAVEVKRELEGHSAVGQVVVRAASAPAPAQAPHVKLAGARAWLKLGQERLAEHQAQAAVACARKGLEELGSDYAAPDAGDDTVLKLAAAEELLKAGRADNAASTMLRTLDGRARLYVDQHKDTIAP